MEKRSKNINGTPFLFDIQINSIAQEELVLPKNTNVVSLCKFRSERSDSSVKKDKESRIIDAFLRHADTLEW